MNASPVSYIMWTDFPPERTVEFNEWYNREHAPDRVLRIPGFIQARRFVAVEGAPQYAAWFDVEGPAVFRNDAYLEMRRSPDPRSLQFIPLFRNAIRFVGQAAVDAVAVPGIAEGAWVRFAAFEGDLEKGDVGRWSETAAALVRKPGIMRARVFQSVPELLDGAVRNMKGHVRETLRAPDRLAGWLVMIESVTDEQLAAVEPDLSRALAGHPGWTPIGSARMRQLMRVAKP